MHSHPERLDRIVVVLLEVVEALGDFLVSMGCSGARIEVVGLHIVSIHIHYSGLETTHQGSHSVVESHPGLAEGYYIRMVHHLAAPAEAHCIVVEEVHSCQEVVPRIRHHHTRRHLGRSLAVGMIWEALESMTAGDNHQLDVVLHHSLAVPGRRPFCWRSFRRWWWGQTGREAQKGLRNWRILGRKRITKGRSPDSLVRIDVD
jgi:hypothetical protein